MGSAIWRYASPKLHQLGWLAPMAGALAGCSTGSAPAIVLFGAYFPDWLIFALLAIVTAITVRILFGIAGIAQSVPYPLFTFVAIGVLAAGAIDLLWLDR